MQNGSLTTILPNNKDSTYIKGHTFWNDCPKLQSTTVIKRDNGPILQVHCIQTRRFCLPVLPADLPACFACLLRLSVLPACFACLQPVLSCLVVSCRRRRRPNIAACASDMTGRVFSRVMSSGSQPLLSINTRPICWKNFGTRASVNQTNPLRSRRYVRVVGILIVIDRATADV